MNWGGLPVESFPLLMAFRPVLINSCSVSALSGKPGALSPKVQPLKRSYAPILMFTLQQGSTQPNTVPTLSLRLFVRTVPSVASLAVPHPRHESAKLCHRSIHWQMTTARSCSLHGSIMPSRKYPTSKYKPRSSPQEDSRTGEKDPYMPLHHFVKTSRRGTIGQGPWRGVVNHTGELVQPPHLPAGVDETDAANVVLVLMPLAMHAR